MRKDTAYWNSLSIKLTTSDQATLLTIIFALIIAVVASVGWLPPNLAIVILAGCGGGPLAVNYAIERDLFAPVAFLGLGYLITVFGPALDFAFFGSHDRVLLLGNGPKYLVIPMLATVIYVVMVLIGLVLSEDQLSWDSEFGEIWNLRRGRNIGIALIILGSVALILFIHSTSGIPTSFGELSSKRYSTTGYLRWGTQFLLYGNLVLFANFLSESTGWGSTSGFLFTSTFPFAVFVPVFMSQRSVLLTFLIALAVVAYYKNDWLTGFKLSVGIPTAILMSNIMLILRRNGQVSLSKVADVESFTGFFAAGRGGLATQAHLLHLVPKEIGYRFGATLITWIVFPIPRSFWGGKPKNLGQQLGVLIYGRGKGIVGAGTPPFIAGELYLNFGLLGIVFGGLVFGVLVGIGAAYLRPSSNPNTAQVVLYAVFTTQFVLGLMRGDLTPTMVAFLKWIVILVPTLAYITHGFGKQNECDKMMTYSKLDD